MLNLLSWVGVLIAFFSYVGGCLGWWSFEDWKYHAISLANSVLLTAVFAIVGMPAYIAFNAAWGTVALIKLWNIWRRGRWVRTSVAHTVEAGSSPAVATKHGS